MSPDSPPNQFPSFLILPINVYNRLQSMNRMRIDGFKSPVCSGLGWCTALPPAQSKYKEEANEDLISPSWAQWTGLEDVSITPPWIISKILYGGSKSNVRVVFVRRQSDDCGGAVSPSLRKSIFGREFRSLLEFLMFEGILWKYFFSNRCYFLRIRHSSIRIQTLLFIYVFIFK